MRNCAIFSTGSYLPETILHNEDLSQFPKTSKMLISQKTGVFANIQKKFRSSVVKDGLNAGAWLTKQETERGSW